MIYYAGVVAEGITKIAQVTNDIDCLSCEILAYPGVITFEQPTVNKMIFVMQEQAKLWGCHYLEVNCSKGKGSYQYLKVN